MVITGKPGEEDITGEPDKKAEPVIHTEIDYPVVRLDRFALLVASWVFAILLLAAGPALVAADVVQLESTREPELGAVKILEKEAEVARTVAQALYSRSTLLLMGGIVIAFTGVVVFYLALPD